MRRILLGLAAATVSVACAPDCKKAKAEGASWASLVCGGEGDTAETAVTPAPSACQPRAVMPQFYALLDSSDPSFAGLKDAVKDLGTIQCAVPQTHCTSDDQCNVGHCGSNGLCPCTAPYSPLNAVMSVAIHGLGAVAGDVRKAEPGAVGTPACLPPAAAKNLAPDQRSRLCEMRRTLDVLLQNSGGQQLIDDPQVRRVLVSLLDYVQGKTDGKPHYDLFEGVGRMASLESNSCDPGALWNLLDAGLAVLTPDAAAAQLAQIQTLLADPYTKTFLTTLSGSSSAQGRDSAIVLLHTLTPSLLAAKNSTEALGAINNLLDSLVYGSTSIPDSFKNEVKAVMTSTGDLLGQPGVLPPLQKMLACAASAEVRCSDATKCTTHDDELVGALYDLLSRNEVDGGLDLATLVGAARQVALLDPSGQVGRTVRMVAQGVMTPDESGGYPARDAIADLARQSLTAQEAQKLLPAVGVLVDKRVLVELFNFLHSLLYSCPTTP